MATYWEEMAAYSWGMAWCCVGNHWPGPPSSLSLSPRVRYPLFLKREKKMQKFIWTGWIYALSPPRKKSQEKGHRILVPGFKTKQKYSF